MDQNSIYTWLEIAGFAVQALSLFALIVYVIKTWEMASATRKAAEATQNSVREMRDARDQETAPYVVVYFEVNRDEQTVYLVLENIGKTTATDVQLHFDPPLQTTNKREFYYIKDGIASMPPGYRIKDFLDTVVAYLSGGSPLPVKYSVTISYYGGIHGERREIVQVADLSPYRGVAYLQHPETKMEKGVRRIADEQTKLADAIKDGASKVEKALLNAQITNHEIDGDLGEQGAGENGSVL